MFALDSFVAVAMANRLPALLIGNIARKARRGLFGLAGGAQLESITSALLTRIGRSSWRPLRRPSPCRKVGWATTFVPEGVRVGGRVSH